MKTIKVIGNLDPYTTEGFKCYFARRARDGHCWNDLQIVDAIPAECLCFYSSCPNLEDYLEPRVLVRLDQYDMNEARKTVESTIKDNEWEKRLPYIRQTKKTILNELQFVPTLDRVLSNVAA